MAFEDDSFGTDLVCFWFVLFLVTISKAALVIASCLIRLVLVLMAPDVSTRVVQRGKDDDCSFHLSWYHFLQQSFK